MLQAPDKWDFIQAVANAPVAFNNYSGSCAGSGGLIFPHSKVEALPRSHLDLLQEVATFTCIASGVAKNSVDSRKWIAIRRRCASATLYNLISHLT